LLSGEKHSGSAENAHGASPRNAVLRRWEGGAVCDAFGGTLAFTEAIFKRRRSRFA
jgi:hypothetical protein